LLVEFVAIPMRTRVWFPAWSGTVSTFVWWAGWVFAAWVVVPAALLRTSGPLPFRVGLPATLRDTAPYLAMLGGMLTLLYAASQRGDFQNTYPLFRPSSGVWTPSLLAIYWCCYALILFGTEFLFRGVLLFALAPRLGSVAIGVSVIPYALIHVHKPLPEAFGSIVAGYVLGWMAWRTRSIGGGVLIHCAVAFTMDALALARAGVW
jgi:membrane protease YdiL (CAAX protease family)